MSVSKGDKVRTTATKDYNGNSLASFVRNTVYEVIEVNGDRVVIGLNGVVTAAVHADTITQQNNPSPSPSTPEVQPAPEEPIEPPIDPVKLSQGIDKGLQLLLGKETNQDVVKYSMRLFGVPHQFTGYCDYRSYSNDHRSAKSIGRKFIDNIFLNAPIVTFIPGKPSYLPGIKDKEGATRTLVQNASDSISGLLKHDEVSKNRSEKMRYYGFEQDYIEYSKYVNILCASIASFLELGDIDAPTEYGDKKHTLVSYDWKQYRWTETEFKTTAGKIIGAAKNGIVDSVKKLAGNIENFLKGNNKTDISTNETSNTIGDQFSTDDDNFLKDILDSAEDLAATMCYIQFYVDAGSGLSESSSNSTSPSKIESAVETGSDLSKELAFAINSGGMDKNYWDDKGDDITKYINDLIGDTSKVGGFVTRLTSSIKNVIQGDNMIFPEIYRDSKYSKNYRITIDLRCPYGNKYSYFLNVIVPLMHIIAFSIPKQQTANTFGSPFLVKAMFPGVFSCNMGIISSIQIEKCPDGDEWTVDGFPSHIRVSVDLMDLYSDLTISSSDDVNLFLENSSLIDYLAVNSGVDLTKPQLKNRINLITTAWSQALHGIDDNIEQSISEPLNNLIQSMVSLSKGL